MLSTEDAADTSECWLVTVKSASAAVSMPCSASSRLCVSWYAADITAARRRLHVDRLHRGPARLPPITRCWAVLIGMIAWSSSFVAPVDPVDASTPITCERLAVDRHRLPDRVDRTEQLGRRARTRAPSPRRPSDRPMWTGSGRTPASRARTDSQDGEVPTTLVVQFVEPFCRVCRGGRGRGDRGRRPAPPPGTRARSRRLGERGRRPEPAAHAAGRCVLPGETMSRLVPSACTCATTCRWAPMPRPTVRMTAAMPMRMPSMVSPDRSRCVRIASRPVRSVSAQLTGTSPAARWRARRGCGSSARRSRRPPARA